MFLSPLFRKAVLCSALALCLGFCFSAKAALLTNGGEYLLSGKLSGDQVWSRLAVNTNGGYLVFEDNAVDGNGEGIGAQPLDNNYHPCGPRFRVNQNLVGDQERPQVALLNGGGAVFVWQSRPLTSPRHVFARFLSSSNTWFTGDVLVGTFTKDSQINPAVTVLQNGNVAITYSSYNQVAAGSMQDVYLRIFSPAGDAVSSELPVNQVTAYNQRTPAIAALSSGGFVVAWVSEQQRFRNSVDIYARLFAADGNPSGSEFVVDTTVTNTCANPAIAANNSGGFTIAWSELDLSTVPNGWDVYSRGYSSPGAPGPVTMLNSYVFGNQYGPAIVPVQDGMMAIWTSLGQDGSDEGVYGRFLDSNGAVSGNEFRVNTSVAGAQQFPAIACDGGSRVLACWSGFSGIDSGEDIYAQLYASADFIPVAAVTNYYGPASDPFPTDGSGNGSGPGSITDGGGTSQTNGPTGLPAAVGNYYGEFYDAAHGVSASDAGSFTATISGNKNFSIKVVLGGKTYSASGKIDSNGAGSATIGKGTTQCALNFQVDLNGGNQITGTLSNGVWSAQLFAAELNFSKVAPAKSFAGSYTLHIPADASSQNSPQGDGVASVVIDSSGGVQVNGSLADGTKLTEKTAISAQGYWPLFASLYGGQGCIMGWLQVTNGGVISGQAVWIKNGGAKTTLKSYAGGFTNNVEVTGAAFQKVVPGRKALSWPSGGRFILAGGGLSAPITNSVQIDLNNKVTEPGTSKLKLAIVGTTGLYQGSVADPSGTGKALSFFGAISQGGGGGSGYFLNGTKAGRVDLEGVQ